MAKVINRTHSRYARIVNKRHDWTGHLFANRYYSTALDELQLWQAVKYIELNPVRAGLVARAEEFPWSSARAHALNHPDALLSPRRPFPGGMRDWRGWLAEGLSVPALERLRDNTRTGRPTGEQAFVDACTVGTGLAGPPKPRGPRPVWDSGRAY
jgi:putative transposase